MKERVHERRKERKRRTREKQNDREGKGKGEGKSKREGGRMDRETRVYETRGSASIALTARAVMFPRTSLHQRSFSPQSLEPGARQRWRMTLHRPNTRTRQSHHLTNGLRVNPSSNSRGHKVYVKWSFEEHAGYFKQV